MLTGGYQNIPSSVSDTCQVQIFDLTFECIKRKSKCSNILITWPKPSEICNAQSGQKYWLPRPGLCKPAHHIPTLFKYFIATTSRVSFFAYTLGSPPEPLCPFGDIVSSSHWQINVLKDRALVELLTPFLSLEYQNSTFSAVDLWLNDSLIKQQKVRWR